MANEPVILNVYDMVSPSKCFLHTFLAVLSEKCENRTWLSVLLE